MLQRVMPGLMGMKRILALNDEAHHCYREKPAGDDDEGPLKGDDRKEAERNREAARVWIAGLEVVQRKLGLQRVIDLSATPFFLRGSGYREGTLFPWTASDFSLMDAIESGIVKLPRVPVADNIPGGEMPKFRNLWEHIRPKMPKRGRGKAGGLDPLSLPVELQTALEALHGHYEKTFDGWRQAGIEVPPCFIVVCNNTSTSKLVHDFIAGFSRENEDGSTTLVNGRLPLFRNFDEHGNRLACPHTLLIDSEQLDSGEALDKNFRAAAGDEIERFRRERIRRTRRSRPEPDPHPRPAEVDAALPPDETAGGDQVARSRRGAEAAPVRPAQADHPPVARRPPRVQGRHVSGAAHVARSWRTWPASGSRPGSSRVCWASARSCVVRRRDRRTAPARWGPILVAGSRRRRSR